LYRLQGQFDLALDMFKRALNQDPHRFQLYYDLGEIYRELTQFDQSEKHFKQALAITPTHSRAWGNLATVYKFQKRINSAKKALEKAINLDPTLPHLYFNLAMIQEEMGFYKQSMSNLQRATNLNPKFRDAQNFLFLAHRKTCDWTEINKVEAILDQKQLDSPFVSLLRHDDLKKNLYAAQDIAQQILQSVPKGLFNFPPQATSATKKLKICYFSRDFMNHPTGQLVASMFQYHDRKKFEVFAYSYGEGDDSSFRRQIVATVDHFVDLKDISNLHAAQKIYQDGIDILVDLSGHTAENRLAVCAMRPSPIQISWIGFLGTTGANFFDYMLVDKIVVPPSQSQYYTEKLIYIPRCYQVTNTFAISSKKYSRKDFGLPQKGFVFACFLSPQKIDPQVWHVWMQILNRVPNSVLWLWGKNNLVPPNLRHEAKKFGVDPARLVFFDKLPLNEHLKRISLADLALDTFVYQGANTVSCSLWAGVPVLTKIGNHFASRVSASFLIHANLPQLVTTSDLEYKNRAVYLAKHPIMLRKYRKLLAHNIINQHIYDTRGFVKDLEQLYLKMWNNYIIP
jgi:protein O-GlcNAc transferase